jgi:KH domain
VRCGSRPSKRMEQLVHLRLKSIYKAFKQNTSHQQNHSHGGPASLKASFSLKSSKPVKSGTPRLKDDYDFDDPDDLDTLFHAGPVSVAAAASSSKSKQSFTGGAKNKNSVSASRLLQQQRHDFIDSANRFKEEKERADAAAAALLAELDEEEEIKGKNSKKKKKKNKSKQPPLQSQQSGDHATIENKNSDDVRNEVDFVDDGIVDIADDDVSSTEYISALAMLKEDYDHWDRKPSAKVISPDGSGQDYQTNDNEQSTDYLENELLNLIAKEDIDGLESLLESIKGIPGRAGIRKNAKKALKRLRLESAPQLIEEPNEPTIEELEYNTIPDAFANPDSNGYLQIVSLTHNKPSSQCATPGSQHGIANAMRSRPSNSGGPLKSECVMHVRPLIVGWMIGKGGQRIRDLMEESGARIWIDQDSMGSQDPRLLYISGSRKNVDIAMDLLSDLVSKYQPLSSSHVRQQATTNPPPEKVNIDTHAMDSNVSESADISPGPLTMKMGPSLSNRNGVGASGDVRAKQVVFCDPRFVPLLIGKRGWTIKNIQDTTGAKVDIDQTVTPRRITVSGSEGSVEKAMRMVRDVLSYPHSQLHGSSADNTNMETMTETVSASREHSNAEAIFADVGQLEENLALATSQEAGSDLPLNAPLSAKISGHSPPSSLIMTRDAKSTISASSSLSSTPEPTLPVSSTAKIPQLDIGPATFSPEQGRTMFNAMGGDMPQGSGVPLTPLSPAGNAAMFLLQGANNVFDARDQSFPSMQPLNPVYANMNVGGSLHHVSPNQQTRPTYLSEQQNMFLSQPNPQPLSMTDTDVFPPPQSVYGATHRLVGAQGSIQNSFLPNTNVTSGVGSTGFWNGIGTSHGFTQGGIGAAPSQHVSSADNFHLNAAVEFLEHSQQLHPKPLSTIGDANGLMGLSVPSTNLSNQSLQNNQDNLLSFTRRQDDAQMVDSLFGPSTTPAGPSTMLSRLQGLSLNPNEASTGLWGSGDPLVDSTLRPLESAESLMFGSLSSPHPPTERKSESRFLWGESGSF